MAVKVAESLFQHINEGCFEGGYQFKVELC